MCDICWSTPCLSRCPNAPEPELAVFAECDNCGEDILDGEDYYEVGDMKFCELCVHCKQAVVEE